MSKAKAFMAVSGGFLAGVFLASLVEVKFSLALVLLGVCISVLAIGVFSRVRAVIYIFLFLSAAAAGILRFSQTQNANPYQNILGEKVEVRGFITEEADVRSDKQLLTFMPEGFGQSVLITTNLSQEFAYGDEVVLMGKVEEAKNFSGFDYKGYLQAHNIYAVSSRPKLLILKSHRLNIVKENLLQVKLLFVSRINFLLGEPEGSLLLGILLGAKKTLPQSLTDAFARAGLSHIIAVSGFNISIIVSALSYAAYFIGRRHSFWLSLAFIAGFTIITGASASVVRAAVMGVLLLVALRSGRLYNTAPALLATAALMVLLSPKILVFDVGFQLSFLATAGIIYGVPVLKALSHPWKKFTAPKELILTTISAIVATLPLLLYKFGSLSLIAVLANLLVLPLVPGIMLLGFLCVLPFFGSGFAYVTGLVLKLVIVLVEFMSAWKYASLPISINVPVFILMYAVIICLYLYLKLLIKRVDAEAKV